MGVRQLGERLMTVTVGRDVPPIVFCPVCAQDTLPLPSGIFGWCDTQLLPPKASV